MTQPAADGFTLFAVPKGFRDDAARHQRNALASWRALGPHVEIILFADDPGTREAAEEFGAVHVPDVAVSELGTPLLHAVFAEAQRRAKWPIVMFTNADIIYTPDLVAAIAAMREVPRFLTVGQRIDLDVEEDVTTGADALPALIARAATDGVPHAPAGSDYFIFRRGTVELPPFSVGRPGWDNWLLYWARREGVPLIDATADITAIHQNHDYSHSKFGGKTHVRGPEYFANIRLAGGFSNMLDLRSADWQLRDGRATPKPLVARLRSWWWNCAPVRHALAARRRRRAGL